MPTTADQITALRAQLQQAQAKIAEQQQALESKERPIAWKVSAKGAISVSGLNRLPTSLYIRQWERLAAHLPAMLKEWQDAEKTGKTFTATEYDSEGGKTGKTVTVKISSAKVAG